MGSSTIRYHVDFRFSEGRGEAGVKPGQSPLQTSANSNELKTPHPHHSHFPKGWAIIRFHHQVSRANCGKGEVNVGWRQAVMKYTTWSSKVTIGSITTGLAKTRNLTEKVVDKS